MLGSIGVDRCDRIIAVGRAIEPVPIGVGRVRRGDVTVVVDPVAANLRRPRVDGRVAVIAIETTVSVPVGIGTYAVGVGAVDRSVTIVIERVVADLQGSRVDRGPRGGS